MVNTIHFNQRLDDVEQEPSGIHAAYADDKGTPAGKCGSET